MKNKFNLPFALLTIIFLAFPPNCLSEQPDPKIWDYVGYNFNYNKKIIKKSPDLPLVWSYMTITDDVREKRVEEVKKYDPEKSIKYKDYHHEVVLWEIDCNKRLLRMKEYIDFDKNGKVIDRYKYNDSGWDSILSKSRGETLYKKACVPPKTSQKK